MKDKSFNPVGFVILLILVAFIALVVWPIIVPNNRSSDDTSLTNQLKRTLDWQASPDIRTMADGNNSFAVALYRQLKVRHGNLFFSPYGIYTSLAMTYAGARGQTEAEMAKTLHFSLPQQNFHAAFGEMIMQMEKIQQLDHIALASANSLWCQQDYRFTNTFLNLIHKDYDAEARNVDFKNSPQTVSDEINKWIAQKTGGKINNAVAPSQITPDVRLILYSAIYFKGQWQTQFNAKNTKPMPFYVSTNQTVTVPMMCLNSKFKTTYSDDYSVKLLELPYSGNDLSMIIFLPESEIEQNTLCDLEQKMATENIREWLAKLDQTYPHKTSVCFPRFTTTQSFDLGKELNSLGMTMIFNKNADFSGMNGTTNLFVSSVNHETFIEVNEEGTEAAAVARINAHLKSAAVLFKADHPFVFLIRENHTGTILFIGRIVDPTK
jgi:serine protease inhibitor